MNVAVGARPAAAAGEFGKLWAFLRRDALIAWSYRRGLVSDLASLMIQAVVFYYVSSLIDPARMPRVGGTRADYMAFVLVGMVVAAFYNSGVGRMMGSVRSEQLMGTFEVLLMTPTRYTTLQAGFVIYELLFVPVRTLLFMSVAVAVFGINLHWSGLGLVGLIVVALLPFIWGIAAGMTAFVVTFRQAAGLVGFANFALILGAGTYFPLDILPPWLAATAALNPLAHALNGARAVLIGGAGWSTVAPQLLAILPISVLTWLIGTFGFRFALERERRAGTVGLY